MVGDIARGVNELGGCQRRGFVSALTAVTPTPEFREAIVAVLARKIHWSDAAFAAGQVAAERLHVHFEQEYAAFVRDQAILLGRAYVECPEAAARAWLAGCIYEIETGRLALGEAHEAAFLAAPTGLGMELGRFAAVTPSPEAARLRAGIDEATQERGWAVALAVAGVLLGGDVFAGHGGGALEHPLVAAYGLSRAALERWQGRLRVEEARRAAALELVAAQGAARAEVLAALEDALDRWLDYREAVAKACGLVRPAS